MTITRVDKHDRMTFVVNDCVSADVHHRDLVLANQPEHAMHKAITGLIWLSMPCHDEPLACATTRMATA